MKQYQTPNFDLVLLGEELIRTSGLLNGDNANIEDMEGIDFSQWN